MQNKKVVIYGSNYSSAVTFHCLQNYMGKSREPFELLLIADKKHYFFKELLPEFLGGVVDISELGQEFRRVGYLRPGISFLNAKLLEVDFEGRTLETTKGRVEYDYLILSTELDECKLPFKGRGIFKIQTPYEILRLKSHIKNVLELAACEKNLDLKRALLTFSIVGEEKESVELAYSVADYINFLLDKEYYEIKKSYITINLISEKNNLEISDSSFYRNYLSYDLERKRIKLLLNSKIVEYKENKVIFAEGKEELCSTLISGRKLIYSTLAHTLNLSSGLNKTMVDLYSRHQKYKNVFIIGEANIYELNEFGCRSIMFYNTEARLCAQNIVSTMNNSLLKPLKQVPMFDFLVNGRRSVVVDYNKMTVTGFFGWVFYRIVFINSILGFRKKASMLIRLIICIIGLNDQSMPGIEFEEAELYKQKVLSEH